MEQINGFNEKDFFSEQLYFFSIPDKDIECLDRTIGIIREMKEQLQKHREKWGRYNVDLN